MPYRGKPSKNCGPCRKRKIKCDLKVPGCTQCSNAGLDCPGYRNQLDLMFLDENERTERSVLKRSNSKKPAAKTSASAASSRRPSPARAITTNSIPKDFVVANELGAARPPANGPPLPTRASLRRKARTATPEEAERMEVSRRRALSQADLDRRPLVDFDFGLNFVDAFGNLTTQPQSSLKLETDTHNYPMIDSNLNRIDPFFLQSQSYNPATTQANQQSPIPQPIYDTLPYDFNFPLSDSINFNLIQATPTTPLSYTAQQQQQFQMMSQQMNQQMQQAGLRHQIYQQQVQQSFNSHQSQSSISPQHQPLTIPGHAMSRQASAQGSETSSTVYEQQWDWTQTQSTSATSIVGTQTQAEIQQSQLAQVDWRDWNCGYEFDFEGEMRK